MHKSTKKAIGIISAAVGVSFLIASVVGLYSFLYDATNVNDDQNSSDNIHIGNDDLKAECFLYLSIISLLIGTVCTASSAAIIKSEYDQMPILPLYQPVPIIGEESNA